MKEELLPDVFYEVCVPEFLDPNWMREQPEEVFRLDRKGRRYYYTLDENNNPTFYISVTTFIQNSLPTSPFLTEWKVQQGENYAEVAEERAHYGTFLHIQCGELLIDSTYNLDTLPYKLEKYADEHKLQPSFLKHSEELKRDVLAFAQFIIDKEVTPIAIEIVLTDRERGLAGAVDLVCEMNVEEKVLSEQRYQSGPRKGQRKEVKEIQRQVCIVDIKSGRKGFWESHEIQLHQYWRMWDMAFPNVRVQKVFNWAPSDWRPPIPSYKLKDQTLVKSKEKLPYLVRIAQVEDERKDNSLTIYHGTIDIVKGLYDNVETISMTELIRKKYDFSDGNVR